jgi:hypothetical protein
MSTNKIPGTVSIIPSVRARSTGGGQTSSASERAEDDGVGCGQTGATGDITVVPPGLTDHRSPCANFEYFH